jgi:hypothetical protein
MLVVCDASPAHAKFLRVKSFSSVGREHLGSYSISRAVLSSVIFR